MRPVHDMDVLILMATALAAKRRPAELVEIVAAAELLQGFIPFVEKLEEALQRLSTFGLIVGSAGGFTLTPAAQEIMASLPKRADTEALAVALKGSLASHEPGAEHPAILLTREQATAAVLAHKASRKAPGSNLLMPKPKADRHFKVDGRWRRVAAPKRHKT